MNVLIAYKSRKGSNQQVAMFLGDQLRTAEFEVTVADMSEITSLTGYDAILIGSPVYEGMWLPEVFEFIDTFGETLATLPSFVWTICVRVLEPNGYEHAAKNYIPHQILEKMNVQDIHIFAGRLKVLDINWDDRWALALHYDGRYHATQMNADFRNWQLIGQWSAQVIDQLHVLEGAK
jgi:menaquinone-dependent protoporphyrinogen oxidase